ncbi:uncharacterized protein GIQ15_00655 [Arthroderma uncinatum]|uniref:uncharacterized protein n=1 Tax=Arthroderma uncinatum TaxID=74035 RepID=UPI00144A9267|nr:uncharacterized protein GIQ15_00655 [Arthroderma uncinatum]KAF3491138.1 hypothetical protein GIQ15_00655 [Arthroderma uncinatum]
MDMVRRTALRMGAEAGSPTVGWIDAGGKLTLTLWEVEVEVRREKFLFETSPRSEKLMKKTKKTSIEIDGKTASHEAVNTYIEASMPITGSSGETLHTFYSVLSMLLTILQAANQQLAHEQKSFLSVPYRALSSSSPSPRTPENVSIGRERSRHGAAFTAATDRLLTSHVTKRAISGYKESYVAYGATKKLFSACAGQAEYTISEALRKAEQIPKTAAGEDIGEGSGWWYEELGLLPTFSSWSQVTFLHMYLMTVRLRGLSSPESVQTYNRYLLDHFSHEAERRMDEVHGITARGIRVTYLKDLFIQWRGVLAAYDEGLVKGDAQLAAAVWRNLFKGLPTDHKGNELDWAKIAKVVVYMRRTLDKMAPVDEVTLLTEFAQGLGASKYFVTAENDGQLVQLASRGAKESFKLDPKPLGKPQKVIGELNMADPMPQVQIELPAVDVDMAESTAQEAEEEASGPSNDASKETEEAEEETQEPAAPVVATQKDLFLNVLKSPIIQLVLGKGEEETILTAHQAVLESSPFFAEKLSQFESGGERRISLEDENPDAVACFLQFQYTGEYFPRCIPNNNKDLEQDPAIPSTDEVGNELLKHGRVYTLAEKLGIPKLQALAFDKICRTTSTASAEIVYARYVYSNTSPSDETIRKPIAKFWCTRSVMRHEAEDEFRALCLDFPQFGFDILNTVLNMKEKHSREREATSSPVPKGSARKRSRIF